jgi:TPR repeat protein
MRKSGVIAFFAAAVFAPFMAQAGQFEEGMNTMWEVLWHQSGTATRLVRWEQDIKVRVHGVNAVTYREHALRAVQDAAAEAGVKVIDVSERADAAEQANLSIEITPDNALSDAQPCESRLSFRTETTIDSATMQMRGSDALRCAYHESMHVMGVRGHPEGKTVLSYFTTHSSSLLPLDKAMLRAWYSPKARAGMTPFEMLPLLADQLVAISADKPAAQKARDRFLARTVEQMQAFANGQGDVPMIVKRCGKATDMGVRFGRAEMSYFLGVAYERGVTVAQDTALAARWLQRAGTLGSRSAQARLANKEASTLVGSS